MCLSVGKRIYVCLYLSVYNMVCCEREILYVRENVCSVISHCSWRSRLKQGRYFYSEKGLDWATSLSRGDEYITQYTSR